MCTFRLSNPTAVVAVAVLLHSGCSIDFDLEQAPRPDGEQNTISSLDTDPSCPIWGCGTNSATVGDGVVFDELDGSGADTDGISIANAMRLGQPVVLRVVRQSLYAIATDGTRAVYSGKELKNTTFELTGTTSSGVRSTYVLTIRDVRTNESNPRLVFWAGEPGVVPFYLIQSQRKSRDGTVSNICKVNLQPGEAIPPGLEHYAVVFAGDHYDARAKTVTDIDSNTLFRLACAGTASAKMHLMRHTRAGAWTDDNHVDINGNPPYYTTSAFRQAMLKMFTADYCGKGRSFTRDGQPLNYGDKNLWYPHTPNLQGGKLDPSDGVIIQDRLS